MMWMHALLLFAQEQKKQQESPWWMMFLPILLIMVLFYVFIILPNQRRERKMREQLGALKKNDRVMTHAGIIGVISYIDDKDNEVTLRLEEGKMRVLKSAIARILTPEGAQEAEKKG